MTNDEELAVLLDAWQDAEAGGTAVSPEELCREWPTLLPDLSRRIAVLRRFDGLRRVDDDTTGEFQPAQDDTSSESHPAGGPTSPLAVGADFGGYRIVALLGEGGMGCVYRAADPVLRRDVALKVMKPEVAARPQARERFLREARALAAVQHDHVAPIYHVGEVKGVPFLTMPLLRGETLAARLKREKSLPAAEVSRIGREAASGLAAVHAADVIHRDIKPANLWLESAPPLAPPGRGVGGEGYRVKLLDFGLAREQGEGETITYEGVVVGTPAYMSPEQADGQPLDARTDLFSLGSVLYECATGQRPFRGKGHTAILTAVTQHHPPAAHEVAPSVPVELSALIMRLLAKAPADRPESALAVVAAIHALDKASETVPILPAARQRLPRRVGPWIGAAAAVVLLGLIGLLAFHYWPPPTTTTTDPSPTAPSAAPPAAVPLAAKLDVRIWKKADTSKGLNLSEEGALPLRAGDWMRIEVESNRPAYFYLIYLDAQGEASPLFPWRKYDWDDQPRQQRLPRLYLPEDPQTDGAPLAAGPSGIEAVLLLAHDEPLSAAEIARLREPFQKKPPAAKFDPLRAAVWLGAEERFGNTRDRARPELDQSGTVRDPVERMRRLVGKELKGLGDDVRGVCYPFEGK